MEAPGLIHWAGGGASPYWPTLYLTGQQELVSLLTTDRPEVVRGVGIEMASDGVKKYWRVKFGGDWVLVKTPGYLNLEAYPRERQPVGQMPYLALKPGERFGGRMGYGKNRSYSCYSAVLTEEGVTLTPIERERWGDRASDITLWNKPQEVVSTASAVKAEVEPVVWYDSKPEGEEETEMERALRKAGLI